MNTTITFESVARARRSGSEKNVAEALLLHANALLENGDIAGAQRNLDEAIKLNKLIDEVYDEARCLHLSATLCRFQGLLPEAKRRVKRALHLAQDGTPIAVSVTLELGEIALAEKQLRTAIKYYGEALQHAKQAGLVDKHYISLLRKRANILAQINKYEEALQDLDEAYQLSQQLNDGINTHILIEKATVLGYTDKIQEADAICQEVDKMAMSTNNYHALADVNLLQSHILVESNQLKPALMKAQKSQKYALKAVEATSYIGATIAISNLSERLANHLEAYESLVVGWVTLADLLGRDLAKATFKPQLLGLRKKWGDDTFFSVKTEYEASKRKTTAVQKDER